jgi:ribosomal protein L11 methyltransferase
MQYIEIKYYVQPPEVGNEILIALLADVGCESFMEFEEGVMAYIPQKDFKKELLEKLPIPENAGFSYRYEISEIEDQNWNAVWESNYAPVLIENQCYIRAPFHETRKDVAYDILIEPKMSFGTAHHETTALMISYLLQEDCKEKEVLDMGCGTGILAILASMRQAKHISAIDTDEWAYKNCLENAERNRVANIDCLHGDVNHIPQTSFDIILANINRNVLLKDMSAYVAHLKKGGVLFLSGFYETEDLPIIKDEACRQGLTYVSHKTKNKWTAVKFKSFILG